ncbi:MULTISPECIES: MBL fold metallo-hydrolase [Rhizobium]|uniref:MBL fold metallo-hydrolase n=1 Tax=Rhizobium phaseoli TaxID=396 RepID=UPI0001907188|nr:MBL fold metallo-hydrolase [Rhizobium phaseoli]ARM16101.1 metallo-beta-lactamase family hydrolase protein [Rhizobium phaseoli Brasil 5]
MKQIYPDLWQTRAEHPFSGVSSHAYLLIRETGNILFYSSGVPEDLDHMGALGGVAYHCISHRDEVGPALLKIKQRFGAKLCCHRLEAKAVDKVAAIDHLFEGRENLPGGVEVIHTPGHTDGSVCFLVPSGEETYLLTGDTIYRHDGAWETRVNRFVGGGSRSDLKASLALLGELSPTVVISSASMGDEPYRKLTPDEWRADIANVLRKV